MQNKLLYGSLVNAYVFMKGEQDITCDVQEKFNEAMQRLEVLGEQVERVAIVMGA